MLGPWKMQDVGFKYVCTAGVIYRGYMYQFGGRSTAGSQLTTDSFIMSAKILEDGSLGPANLIGATSEPTGNSFVAQVGEYVFLIGGGIATTATDRVVRYKLEAGGGCSAATIMEPLNFLATATGLRMGQSGDIHYLYGNTIGLMAFRLADSGAMKPELIAISPTEGVNWISGTPVFHRGNFMLVGGSTQTGNLVPGTIWSCRLNGFSAGPWRKVGVVPAPYVGVYSALWQVVVVDDKLVMMGGGGTNPTGRCWVASLDVDSNVGAWVETSSLSAPYRSAGLLTTKNHIYLFGGFTTASTRTNTVMHTNIVRGS